MYDYLLHFFSQLMCAAFIIATLVKVLSDSLQRNQLSGAFQISGILNVSFLSPFLKITSVAPCEVQALGILFWYGFFSLFRISILYFYGSIDLAFEGYLSIIVRPRHGCYYSFSILLFTRFGSLSFLETYEILFFRGLSLLFPTISSYWRTVIWFILFRFKCFRFAKHG